MFMSADLICGGKTVSQNRSNKLLFLFLKLSYIYIWDKKNSLTCILLSLFQFGQYLFTFIFVLNLFFQYQKTEIMNPVLWFYTIFLIIFVSLLKFIYKHLKEHFRMVNLVDKIPGPKSYPFVGNALALSPDNETCTYQMEKMFRTYTESPTSPGLMRLWIGPKPIILIYKPETIRVILESPNLITKPMEYNALRDWVGFGLLTSTGEQWHTRRKMLTPAFHFSILANSIHTFNRQSMILIEELDKKADEGYPFDFYAIIKNAALDTICESAMGINLGAQKGANPEYCEAVRRMSEMIFMRIRAPWLWPKSLWYLSGYGSEFDENLKIARNVTQKVIIERKHERERIKNDDSSSESSKESIKEIWEEENLGIKAKHKRSAFLDLLLDMQEENKLTDLDILNEVDTFMFEGHDTVSSSMGYTVYMISQKPDIQEKIYEELKGIMETSESEITHEDIGRMKYLEQCLKETMRMFPTVPLIARVIEEDTVVGDYILPKGVSALVAPFAVHRDRRFYENPDNFDPEHFSSENIIKRNPFAYIPFSAGPRNCIGQKFATMEQKLILGRFFRRYKVTAALHELENRGLPELILKPTKGFPVRIERRPE